MYFDTKNTILCIYKMQSISSSILNSIRSLELQQEKVNKLEQHIKDGINVNTAVVEKLQQQCGFIPRLKELYELYQNCDTTRFRMTALCVVLQKTNPDCMHYISSFLNVEARIISNLWKKPSKCFINFLRVYQNIVKEFTAIKFGNFDSDDLIESCIISHGCFLYGNYPLLKIRNCFCDLASNCSINEDAEDMCCGGHCGFPVSKYKDDILGNEFPSDICIFPEDIVKEYWHKWCINQNGIIREMIEYSSDDEY